MSAWEKNPLPSGRGAVKFGSVCSGIEAASVAWNALGWHAAWFSEIEAFPSAVLERHYNGVSNLGDMTTLPGRIAAGDVEAPDVFCGGTPCQAFSVAGLRRSLEDARGNLSLTFCEIADAIDSVRLVRGEPASVVFWENVPGVLSTRDNAFGCFLAQLCGGDEPLHAPDGWPDAGCVSGPKRTAAWRVLDAQYFGLAQRRRRVFVVASAREGFDPSAVLFEFDGLRRDTAPSREAGQRPAPTVTSGAPFSRTGNGSELDSLTTATWWDGGDVAATITTKSDDQRMPDKANAQLVMQPVTGVGAIAFHPTQDPISSTDVCHSIGTGNGQGCATAAVALQDVRAMNGRGWNDDGTAYTVDTHAAQGVATATQVRRLTPIECERLMGFPDNYTAIPWRGKPADQCPDGPRYKALGNSWAVPVVRWIGERINKEVNK